MGRRWTRAPASELNPTQLSFIRRRLVQEYHPAANWKTTERVGRSSGEVGRRRAEASARPVACWRSPSEFDSRSVHLGAARERLAFRKTRPAVRPARSRASVNPTVAWLWVRTNR